ncbi:MAG: hypothetical protein LC660_18455 [Desulfobacteraceae bacterium]|nr:hypothetical protein [Desulfobacteraceae bacterium]
MPSLQVRELPDNIYHLLQKKALAENRSLAQEAISILAKGLNTSTSNKSRRAALLQEIEKKSLPETAKHFNPVELIREDRKR